jgi:hypothetical protein
MNDPPLLAICVPTYERAADMARLLACLDAELPAAGATEVLVSDNASTDGTWQLLQEAAARRPWLRLHRQETNVGPVANLQWLIDHAPPAEYLWCFGDDDLILPGRLRDIVAALRDERPAWLFLPHVFVDDGGDEAGRSPAPPQLERFATAAELYRAYHHWLTFLTASIVRREAFQEANAAIETQNAYIPLLWFFRAGRAGPCVVLPGHVLSGSNAISWADRAHDILTLHFTALWDDGLKAGMTAEEFGATLDGLYQPGWGLEHWRRQPLEALMSVVERFPQSRGLRGLLWTLAREQQRRDALEVLRAAAQRTGDDARAQALVDEGEERYGAGDPQGAVARFADAADVDPTLVSAWNDLAVVLHGLTDPRAARHIDIALFVAPDDADARSNRSAMLAG